MSGGEDGEVRVWLTASGTCEKVLKADGPTCWVLMVAFNPTGKYFASAGRDYKIHLWSVGEYEEIGVVPGHSRSIASVAFSHDGAQMVSASVDESIRVWW